MPYFNLFSWKPFLSKQFTYKLFIFQVPSSVDQHHFQDNSMLGNQSVKLADQLFLPQIPSSIDSLYYGIGANNFQKLHYNHDSNQSSSNFSNGFETIPQPYSQIYQGKPQVEHTQNQISIDPSQVQNQSKESELNNHSRPSMTGNQEPLNPQVVKQKIQEDILSKIQKIWADTAEDGDPIASIIKGPNDTNKQTLRLNEV